MGVPKFFRWMNERYPLCSELIDGSRIPEYDNLYLDMNGIIHNCSHGNDDDPSFRITETQIFLAIFNYIDYIFATIRPRKVFMMAVDGVAPRAKMNQQRARRFRSALDAKTKQDKAIKQGTILPAEPPFDSNCITPGTPFMSRLQDQLTYYINKKISEDAAWKDVKVILSGHNVPGEGEHKIMEYVRAAKATEGYDPNTRHCLYGLDADLIMLGLLSHEPHFSLLREEVTFGRKPRRVKGAQQTFFLLHLSLLREYLQCEFEELKNVLKFEYDFEKILDDFILMAYFVGNDFLPQLPGLHINDGAIVTLFTIYKKILPLCDGYLNVDGNLNLERCQLFFRELYHVEVQEFDSFKGDSKWMESKKQNPSKKSGMELTVKQRVMYERIKDFVTGERTASGITFNWTSMGAGDRKFMLNLISGLGLKHDLCIEEECTELIVEWNSDDDESDEESAVARGRVIKKYDNAPTEQILSKVEQKELKEKEHTKEFEEWKNTYYKEKFELTKGVKETVSNVVYSYVEGLQWVLFYYYHGVPSWEWFYPYHYAPRISDLMNIQELNFTFELGKPFHPFEQLMAVLPPLSKQHVPPCLQDLMTDPTSPIIDFYPLEFRLEKSAKQAEWEAIVKIPFIDEKRLLKAVRGRAHTYSKDEQRRNALGYATLFEYFSEPSLFPSQMPQVFPDIAQCYCHGVIFKIPSVPQGVRVNVLTGGRVGKDLLPGFPSLHTIPNSFTIGHHGVKVFNSESKNASVILSLTNVYEEMDPEDIALNLIGKNVFTGWPFLVESKVMSLSDELFVYTKANNKIIKTPHNDQTGKRHFTSVEKADAFYSKRCGVLIGDTDMIAQVQVIKGLKLLNDGSFVKEFAPRGDFDIPVQLIVVGNHEDPRLRNIRAPRITDEFPVGSPVFYMALKLYGVICEVLEHPQGAKDAIDICVQRFVSQELNQEITVGSTVALEESTQSKYVPGWQMAKQLQIPSYGLSRLTSAFFIEIKGSDKRVNIGLNLKYDYKSLKALGYTQKTVNGWEYSPKALELLKAYKQAFPSVFARLRVKSDAEYYQDVDFFPQNPEAGVEAIKTWLKEQGVHKILSVPNNSQSLSKESIATIEANVDARLQVVATAETELIYIKGVSRKNILKPAHSKFRLDNQKYQLGDRVISTSDEGAVPLGAKGTVVGIDEDVIEVLFDIPIVGGTDLEGRCSVFRGKQCGFGVLLNLTNVQPPYSTHAQRTVPEHESKKVEQFPPPTVNKWGRGPPSKAVQPPVANPVNNELESMLKNMLHINPNHGNPNVPYIPQMPVMNPMYVPVPVPVLYTHDQVSDQFLSMLQTKSSHSVVPVVPVVVPVAVDGVDATVPDNEQDTKRQDTVRGNYRGRGGNKDNRGRGRGRGGRGRGRGRGKQDQ